MARSRNVCAYTSASSIAELAATNSFGIAKNRAFVDGGKRPAFLSVGLFLAIKGYRLKADRVDAIQIILAVAANMARATRAPKP